MNVPKPEVNPPPRMERADTDRYRRYAVLAERLFPDAIGKLIAKELNDTAQFGYRVGLDAEANRLCVALDNQQRERDRRAAAEWEAGQPAGMRRQT